jgi:hypothetical protein
MQSHVTAFALLLALVLTGCVPFPHLRTTKPEITGILLQHGMPVTGVKIYTCIEGDFAKKCLKYKATTTDSQGRFFLEGAGYFAPSVSLISEPLFNYGIDFKYLGGDYHWNEGGIGDTPERVDIRCEIRGRDKVQCTREVTEP